MEIYKMINCQALDKKKRIKKEKKRKKSHILLVP